MSKLSSTSRPSIFKSIRRRIPPLISVSGFSAMIVSLAVLAALIAIVVFTALAMAAYEWPWVGATGGGLMILVMVIGVLLAIAAFIFGLRVALHLTRTKQWSIFWGYWLDKRAYAADWLKPVTTNMRVARGVLHTDVPSGLFVTMALEERFPPRPAQPLMFQDDRGTCAYAGSRGFKGVSLVIPNLVYWSGSLICYDPAGENYSLTAKHRAEVLGQKTVKLDPFNVLQGEGDTWNPLDELNWDDPFIVDRVSVLADSLHELSNSGDQYWSIATRKLLTMTILYVGAAAHPENKNLGKVRDMLMMSDLGVLWTLMQNCEAYGGIVAQFGASNENRAPKELASVMEIARSALRFLDSEPMTEFTATSTFNMRDLKRSKTTVYIIMPAGMGSTYQTWLRVLFNAAFDAMQDQTIPKPDTPVLFLLDEFPLLGRMDRIKQAAGEASKFGVKLFIIAQDILQLEAIYGEEWETFNANAGILFFFSNNDLKTQQYISTRLGEEYYTKVSTGPSGNSSSQELRKVARTDQVGRQASRQSGDTFIFVAGEKPMRLPRANYFDWDMLPASSDAVDQEEEA